MYVLIIPIIWKYYMWEKMKLLHIFQGNKVEKKSVENTPSSTTNFFWFHSLITTYVWFFIQTFKCWVFGCMNMNFCWHISPKCFVSDFYCFTIQMRPHHTFWYHIQYLNVHMVGVSCIQSWNIRLQYLKFGSNIFIQKLLKVFQRSGLI